MRLYIDSILHDDMSSLPTLENSLKKHYKKHICKIFVDESRLESPAYSR